jgi:hypothetical protein
LPPLPFGGELQSYSFAVLMQGARSTQRPWRR